jgi:hypothetical protein
MKDDAIGVSALRKGKSIVFENPVQIFDITTPQEESNPTFKRLKRQLKEEMVEVDKMRKEYLSFINKFKEVMDIHRNSINKETFLAKISFPLHR